MSANYISDVSVTTKKVLLLT